MQNLQAAGCPSWCRTGHVDEDAHHVTVIGRVRRNRPGTADLVGVRLAQSARGTNAKVAITYQRDGLPVDAPRALWLSPRDASVFAGVLDVLGCADAAALVRRAVDTITSGAEDDQAGGQR